MCTLPSLSHCPLPGNIEMEANTQKSSLSPSKKDSEMCKSKINCIIRHRSEPEGRTNNRVDSASTVSCLDTTLSALIMALIPLAKDLQLEPHFHVLSGACQVEPGALYGP